MPKGVNFFMKAKMTKRLLSWYEEYHSRKLKQILDAIKGCAAPPTYNPKKWRGKKLNCYAYALDLDIDDPKMSIWTPGQIASKNPKHQVYTNVTEQVKKDLDVLGISYRENSDVLNPGEWKIAIYYKPSFHDWPIGFHFSRRDADGIWSEKNGWSRRGKINRYVAVDVAPNFRDYGLRLESVLILSKKANL